MRSGAGFTCAYKCDYNVCMDCVPQVTAITKAFEGSQARSEPDRRDLPEEFTGPAHEFRRVESKEKFTCSRCCQKCGPPWVYFRCHWCAYDLCLSCSRVALSPGVSSVTASRWCEQKQPCSIAKTHQAVLAALESCDSTQERVFQNVETPFFKLYSVSRSISVPYRPQSSLRMTQE